MLVNGEKKIPAPLGFVRIATFGTLIPFIVVPPFLIPKAMRPCTLKTEGETE